MIFSPKTNSNSEFAPEACLLGSYMEFYPTLALSLEFYPTLDLNYGRMADFKLLSKKPSKCFKAVEICGSHLNENLVILSEAHGNWKLSAPGIEWQTRTTCARVKTPIISI